MKTIVQFTQDQIAPCGMNCGICLGYQRDKNKCCGCNNEEGSKPAYCLHCSIRNCDNLKNTDSNFCYDCKKYPCKRLKQLDKRYKTKYAMSMLENLQLIKINGLDYFLNTESERWKCNQCGSAICVHRGFCLKCKEVFKA